MRRRIAVLLAAALHAAAITAAAADAPIHALLSADTRPYQEAWEGFRDELNGQASVSVVGTAAIPDSARVVVAFGSKAALEPHRGGARLIICMAPSVSTRHRGRNDVLRVGMTPAPQALIASLKALQPGLSRLAFVWKSEFYGEQYLPQLREAGKAAGIEIESVEIDNDADIPDQLRSLYGHADALWLPPDPLVISERNFLLFRDFSLSNRLPLYVPVPSLAERGATASIGVQFRAIGRTAARVARQALDGETAPVTFPAPVETTLNRNSAAAVGLNVDAETLKAATRVIP